MKRSISVKKQLEDKAPVKSICGYGVVFGTRRTIQNKRRMYMMRSMWRKPFVLAAVMVLSLLVAPLYAATHTLTFTEEDLLISKVDGYDLVLLKDGAYLTDVGKPKLPTKSLRVLIPPGSEVTGIKIDATSEMKLEGSFTIYPAQEFKADFLPPPPFAEPDPVVYGQTRVYPGDLLICVGESYIGGSYEVAHLLVFPLQYVPQSGELQLYKSITFTLTLAEGGPDIPKIRSRSKTSQKSWDLLVKETVINPEDAEAYRVSPKIILNNGVEVKPLNLRQARVNNRSDPSDYIIITSDTTMAEAFMPLADWRIKKGIPTEIFTVPWIESNCIGADIQEKIKNFIYDSYTNRGTQHVLLGGNSDLVPIRYSYIYHYDDLHNGEAATDLYYSNCTVGSEEWVVYEGPKSPTPHITYNPPVGCSINALLPRVNVGRLLVADENQAGDVINKILTYERDVPAMDYHKTFLFHAADEGGRIGYIDFVDPAILDYLRPNTRTLIADGTDADGQSTPENIISFMTGGSDLDVPFNFVWSCSHGNPWGLSTNTTGFTGNHIEQIINVPRFNGSFYAWACTSAPIGLIDPTILAAKWVNLPNGGGLAWIGSSIIAGGDRGVWHARYYHEEMWEDSQDYHHHNLGRAFSEAKIRMIENWVDYPIDPATSWCEYHAIMWNLVGDPMVPLFNHMPGTLDVMVYPQMVEPDIATTLSITVEDDGDPVAGALVCLMKSDENVYLTDYTDANGECQFQLSPLSIAGSIAVTVTKYNYRPYQVDFKQQILVPVDIKPGSDPNSINPRNKGVIPVAILTTDTFDATTVDPLSVEFGPNGATEAHGKGNIEDADGDGDSDLVLHFNTQDTGIQYGDTEATLTGKTLDGQAIEGIDSINTVGCK